MAEKIRFFVLDIKYKVINDKVEIYLFGKTLDGKHIIVIDDSFEPYFYVIPKKGEELNEKIEKLKAEKKEGVVCRVTRTENLKKNFLGK